MNGPLILHMETATDICSVALTEGDRLLAAVESGPERSHARFLNRFIRQSLEEAGKTTAQLDAVAVSKGPGSYTGLRIGVSTAKGMAYALEVPLLSCGTLEQMAHGALDQPVVREMLGSHGPGLLLCPMLDARRMEVYTAFYTPGMEVVRKVSADILQRNSYSELLNKHRICFMGSGAAKCREVLDHPNAHFLEGFRPSASYMTLPVLKRFREGRFEDVAYFVPFYLKDFVATTPRKKI